MASKDKGGKDEQKEKGSKGSKNKVSPISFVLDSKGFLNSLKLAQSIVSGSGAAFVLESTGKELWLWGYSDNTFLRLLCAGVTEIAGEGHFGFETTIINNALKNRGLIAMDKQDATLKFKAKKGKYSGELVTLPISEEAFSTAQAVLSAERSKKAGNASIDADLLAVLQSGLSATALSAVVTQDPLETFIHVAKGKVEVTASDNFHLAYFVQKIKDKDTEFKLSVPKAHFDILSKLSSEFKDQKKSTKLFMGSDQIRAVHASYAVALPATQANDATFAKNKQFVQNLPKPTCNFGITKTEFIKVLENIASVYEDGSYITLTSAEARGKDMLKLSIKTLYGSAEDQIEVTDKKGKPFDLKADPRMLLDILTAADHNKLTFTHYPDTGYGLSVSEKGQDVTYIGCLVGA